MLPDRSSIREGKKSESLSTETLWMEFENWIDDPVASQHRLELVANRSHMMMREAIEALLRKEGLSLVGRSDLIEKANEIIKDGKNADIKHHQNLMRSNNYSKSNSAFDNLVDAILSFEATNNSRIVREYSLSQFDQAKLIVGERLAKIHEIRTQKDTSS